MAKNCRAERDLDYTLLRCKGVTRARKLFKPKGSKSRTVPVDYNFKGGILAVSYPDRIDFTKGKKTRLRFETLKIEGKPLIRAFGFDPKEIPKDVLEATLKHTHTMFG